MRAALLASFFLLSAQARAHGGIDHAVPWWKNWSFSWPVLSSLVIMTMLYSYGWQRMRARRSKRFQIPSHHLGSYLLGIFTLILALVSPIDPLSDELGSVHMVQHTLLMMVAAPLIAIGAPAYIAMWSLPAGLWRSAWKLRRRVMGFSLLVNTVSRPLTAWVLYAVTLWIWHLPVLYQSALTNSLVHDLQHIAFFGTAFLFWRVLFDPQGRPSLGPGPGILYLFVASIHSMILGVLMALAPSVWYSLYERTAPLYGMTALQDQQLAGYIMWMPAGFTYVVVAGVLLWRLLEVRELTDFDVGRR